MRYRSCRSRLSFDLTFELADQGNVGRDEACPGSCATTTEQLDEIVQFEPGLTTAQTLTDQAVAGMGFLKASTDLSRICNLIQVRQVKPGQAYSEVLGNSTLDVKKFLQLQLSAPAGTPNTPSNP